MKLFVVLAVALAYAKADVNELKTRVSGIRDQQFDIQPDGSSFSYLWDTDNNIRVEVVGKHNTPGGDQEQTGSVAYQSPEGSPITWTFKSGVNGYEAVGNAIPTPPPSPPSVLRLLEYLVSRPVYKETGKR